MRRKSSSSVLNIAALLCACLFCMSCTNAQPPVEKYEYKSSSSKTYYLERKWISDSVFSDKYFYEPSEVFWTDTFYLRNGECFFKRGNTYHPYLSRKAFERGDTLSYYYQEAVNTTGNLFMVRDYFYPDKSTKSGAQLVYKMVAPVDDPKYASTKLYFDPEKNLVTKITSIDGVRELSR